MVALLCVPIARAAGGWGPPRLLVSVPSGFEAQWPELVRDSAGDAVSVWVNGKSDFDGMVEASTRRQGGAWSAAVTLGYGETSAPQVAMDPQGHATVVWSQASRDPRRRGEPRTVHVMVEARIYSVAGGWGARAVLAARHERLAEFESEDGGTPTPQVAVRGEEVVVAFAIREHRAKPFAGREDVSIFTEHAGRWSAPSVVGHTVGNTEMRLGVDGRGERVLAWSGADVSNGWVETQIVTRNGRTKGPAQIVSRKSGAAAELSLAVNSRGDAVLTWSQQLADGDGRGPDEATTRPAGGRFDEKPVILVHKAYAALTAIGADGTATVQFNRVMNTNAEEQVGAGLEAATHTVEGSWSKPTLVLRGVGLLALSSGPDGELIGLWEGGVRAPSLNGEPREAGVIDASILPAQGRWQTPQTISPTYTIEEAALGVAANGQATAIWVHRPPPERTETIETSDYQPGQIPISSPAQSALGRGS